MLIVLYQKWLKINYQILSFRIITKRYINEESNFFHLVSIFLIVINNGKSFGQVSQEQVDALNQTNEKTIKLFNGHNLDGWYSFLKEPWA